MANGPARKMLFSLVLILMMFLSQWMIVVRLGISQTEAAYGNPSDPPRKENPEDLRGAESVNFLQESETAAVPVKRSADFAFSNRTIPQFPLQNAVGQQSAPANACLVSEMVSLTISQPSLWRNFSLTENDGFLAVDGASQSALLGVLIEVYSPTSLSVAMNTTSSQPLHFVETDPTTGEWGIHMRLVSAGNTTAWIQAISLVNGARTVVDYHKEITHMYAGQAGYFLVSLSTNDWIDVHLRGLAGGNMLFEAFLPSDFVTPWQSSYYSNYYDAFLSSLQVPQLGTYLFVARDNNQYNAGDADVLVQITRKAAVSRTLYPNTKISLRFNLTYENEYFIVEINQTYAWLSLDGGVTTSGSVYYWFRGPSASIVTSMNSYSPTYPVTSNPLSEPEAGEYLLVMQGSDTGVVGTLQITASVEEADLTSQSDVAICFEQTGQTAYFYIDVTSKPYFVFSASSETGHTIYRIFNFRNEIIWSGESGQPSNVVYTLQVPVGNRCLLSVQGETSSIALIHLRFEGDFDYSLSSPDYSDFELRFSGDFLMYEWVLPDVAYYTQYWHSLANVQIYGQIYDAQCAHLASVSLAQWYSEMRLIWRKGIESFATGNWLVLITGEKCQYLRVSQLRAGNEERIVNTPYHVFESFDFDYQEKIFLVNIPPSLWFSVIPALQSTGTSYLTIYDSQLTYYWGSAIYTSISHPFWSTPNAGNWLMIIDGTSNANVSLSFHTSSDQISDRFNGQYYTDKFGYNGEGRYCGTSVTNTSFLGIDAMGLANGLQTYIYLISPGGQIAYTLCSNNKFDVNHYFTMTPQNGTWFIILIGSPNSQIMYRTTAASDQCPSIPFADSYSSDFDGKVTYVTFDVKELDELVINFTNQIDSDSWLWIHAPSGQLWFSYQFYYRDQSYPLTIASPYDGEWHICLIQEIYANLTISCGGEVKPPPKPTGVFVEFIYPVDAQMFRINDTTVVLPEINGRILVVANITDHYHSIGNVLLHYGGGVNSTSMAHNPYSQFYEVTFDTTIFPDGLYELIIYAQCQQSEFGIASISIRIDNNGTFPPIDDVTPPTILEVHREPENVSEGESPLIWTTVADRDTEVSLVILSFSIDEGQNWEDITMYRKTKLSFEGHIPAFSAGTEVMYAIVAYDYVQNRAVDNNAGSYFVYKVVPEFPSFLILSLFIMATLLPVAVHRRKRAHNQHT